jgi:hypothetical protein
MVSNAFPTNAGNIKRLAMHSCPDCGQACYCHGDIDDCEVETVAYSSARCTHDCEMHAEYDDDEYWADEDDARQQALEEDMRRERGV